MHIMECMTIDMRNVTGDWVTFNDFALPGYMPHGNNFESIIMHAIDMVFISIDSQWQWQSFEMRTRSVACKLRDTWSFP